MEENLNQENLNSENANEEHVNIEEKSIEYCFLAMENIIAKMESKEVSLEDSFRLYSQGMTYLAAVNQKIDTVEKEVKKINESGEFEDFQINE